MNKEELFETINDIDDTYIAEVTPGRLSNTGRTKRPTHPVRWVAGIAACAAAFIFAVVLMHSADHGRIPIELSDASKNVTACYIDAEDVPGISVAACLVPLTEEEIFHKYNTVVFRGTVVSIRNIELNYNGWKEYRATAEIRISQVYRGDCRTGDTLTVLLPCPIMEGYRVSACDVAEAVRTGMEGIFMPVKYDNSYICAQNGATLQYNDLAEYGFLDGARWAFLSTDAGLLFDPYAFESLDTPETLDDIRQYIEKMLQSY